MANKDFYEALLDGFKHITDITDVEQIKSLRAEGVAIDEEGYYSFIFGEHHEYELRIEPILEDGMYYVALYKYNVLLTEKLPILKLTTSH